MSTEKSSEKEKLSKTLAMRRIDLCGLTATFVLSAITLLFLLSVASTSGFNGALRLKLTFVFFTITATSSAVGAMWNLLRHRELLAQRD